MAAEVPSSEIDLASEEDLRSQLAKVQAKLGELPVGVAYTGLTYDGGTRYEHRDGSTLVSDSYEQRVQQDVDSTAQQEAA